MTTPRPGTKMTLRQPIARDLRNQAQIDTITDLGLWNMPEWHHRRDAARAQVKSDLGEANRYSEAEQDRVGVTALEHQMYVLSANRRNGNAN